MGWIDEIDNRLLVGFGSHKSRLVRFSVFEFHQTRDDALIELGKSNGQQIAFGTIGYLVLEVDDRILDELVTTAHVRYRRWRMRTLGQEPDRFGVLPSPAVGVESGLTKPGSGSLHVGMRTSGLGLGVARIALTLIRLGFVALAIFRLEHLLKLVGCLRARRHGHVSETEPCFDKI